MRPCCALVYRTSLSSSQYPANYAAANALALPIHGLYDACVDVDDARVPKGNRGVLVLYNDNLTALLKDAVPVGQVYLGGFYVPEMKELNGWCWDDGRSTTCPGLFCTGPTCERVEDTTIPLNWAAGYPKMSPGGGVGDLKYIVYDSSVDGWINVNGTAALDGAVCQSDDPPSYSFKSSKFPWWGIVIILLGFVLIAVAVTIVVCCFHKKKKAQYADEVDAIPFNSRGTNDTDSSLTDPRSFSTSGSFHYTASSKSSVASSPTSRCSSSFTMMSSIR
ncbi:hypothetical protein ABL78_8079 [Leptomonas seymouri]|uniref:Uncharacterized protein n=1 Tax=Leptomonas seymouri TaxID=5684 RepID=A0A0N1HRH3_LEPSE|nr:hypothetical protein ABL78_8079 [Leptomonas seymouri]|eukprot:KPI82910.1 hypothetical protein ABL78_8079 [Leptomonas seymouri]